MINQSFNRLACLTYCPPNSVAETNGPNAKCVCNTGFVYNYNIAYGF